MRNPILQKGWETESALATQSDSSSRLDQTFAYEFQSQEAVAKRGKSGKGLLQALDLVAPVSTIQNLSPDREEEVPGLQCHEEVTR